VNAKIARAECSFELATLPMPAATTQNLDEISRHRQDAVDELKVLYNQAKLPVDKKAEVGYKWGNLIEYGNPRDLDGAATVFFQVVNDILQSDQAMSDLDKTPTGRSWLTKCLTSLREIYHEEQNEVQMRRVDDIIAQTGLGGPAQPVSQPPAPAN
jgi:hypothetical protein